MSNIIAIDPGYDRCGVAVFSTGNTPEYLYSTCITTKKTDSHSKRLAFIFQTLETLILEWKPEYLAIETLFFSVNKKTALKVAEARGAIVALAGIKNIELIELSPQAVKQAVTGVGNADKTQVQKMVSLTLKIDTAALLDDEIDAISLGYAATGTLNLKRFL